MADEKRDDVPSTLRRSDPHAQDVYAETRDSAEEQYGDEGRAARTAWSAVKHAYEKVGDHWEPKDEKGASDAHAAQGGDPAENPAETKGGVDANATRAHLYEQAQREGIEGRSDMTKAELVDALERDSERRTREARD